MTTPSSRCCKFLRRGETYVLLFGAWLPDIAVAQVETDGFAISGAYVIDLFSNVDGGVARGEAVLGKADLVVEADDVFGIDGAQAYVDVQFVHGRALSGELVGDAQVVSNIEAVSALRPLEAWFLIPLGSPTTTIKAGLVDLNGEFDVQNVGGSFLNSSHGIGPDFSQSGLNGPSIFPTTSSALVVTHAVGSDIKVRFGLFDARSGNPDKPRRTVVRFPGASGALLVGEVDLALSKAATIRFGGWAYTSRFEDIGGNQPAGAPRRSRSSQGGYATIETKLGKCASGAPIDAWARIGLANERVNPIGAYVGGGLTFGPEQRRWGAAIAHARLGDSARRVVGPSHKNDRAETNVEITYSHSLGDRVTIQPDLQYVFNPGWKPTRANAIVAGLRVSLSLF